MEDYKIELIDIILTIEKINDKIYDIWQGDKCEQPSLLLESNGEEHVVTFLGIVIFGDDYDTRIHYEGSDTYEDFEKYLTRKIVEYIKHLNHTKKYLKLLK